MDELPDLALIELFNSLPVYDQLKIRGVCRRWKTIVESNLSYRKELVIFYRSISRPLVWFHSDRPVDLLGSVIVNEKFEKKGPLLERLFKCIKRMYFICRAMELIKTSNLINFVNRFLHLEHLQVDILAYPDIPAPALARTLKIRFNMPNLKSFCFYIKECQMRLVQLDCPKLDCPKLESLSVLCHFQLDEKCASFKESLKFLRVVSFEFEQGFELPNLEVLCCQNVLPIDISVHRKLKEIHYYWEHSTYAGVHIDDETRTVLNGLFEQKRRLERSELQIYYQNIRCALEPGGVTIRRTEIPLYFISRGLKLEHQRKDLIYKGELDEEIAALDAEQAEKLARCLREVKLFETLNTNPLLNDNFKILFNYVHELWIKKEIRMQSHLDRLPNLFPHLVELQQGPCYSPDEFGEGSLNFRFLARFKALHILESDRWKVSASELKEMVRSCRFLVRVELQSAKREELANGEIRSKLASYEIHLSDNQFFTGAFEYEYLVKDGKGAEKIGERRNPRGTFQSSEVAVDWLDQRGYLRKEVA